MHTLPPYPGEGTLSNIDVQIEERLRYRRSLGIEDSDDREDGCEDYMSLRQARLDKFVHVPASLSFPPSLPISLSLPLFHNLSLPLSNNSYLCVLS